MSFWLPLLVLATSLVAAIGIFMIPENRHAVRGTFNLTAALIKIALIIWILIGVIQQQTFETRFTLIGDIDFILRADALSLLFAGLSSILWLCTTVYAMGYLNKAPHRSRFFGFFSLCVASTMGIAMAGNLFTFLIFFEMLTLSTYPLVVHKGTPEALRAGRKYLIYTLSGGAVLLIGIAMLHGLIGSFEFAETGVLSDVAIEQHPLLVFIFAVLILGVAVKAAIVPLHGWLPSAMVAPAPVSALLHAVAVVKAGAFGVVRIVHNVYGIEFAQALGVLLPLAIIASVTIIWGSIQALRQSEIKKRLAFSTVSQVSYIILGITLFGPIGTIGGLVHLLHQGITKVTLFFCAGIFAETLGAHKIKELNGVGRRMPLTSVCFTLGALSMIGIPPLAGFISKWYLGWGAMEAGMSWVILVLLASSALNSAYFLPVIYRLWFLPAPATWPDEKIPFRRMETNPWLLWPTIVTATFTVGAGVLAASPLSPLSWSALIAVREYLP
ncbi:proton-conducting membrane transporter [Aliidiomarina minuta]|uniref:Proton-conducting membrane transporter n=1 Tax=Aliidiomarina minuta TaxID=880057 RepID=A0A432W8C9_9GAMM|nr:monovalent cation/H+ antiporter subunit D family protein [Aliidiomarina minuta]RUO26325.1 proton-conducting membrane transporter [Aliidiomarina minuta]